MKETAPTIVIILVAKDPRIFGSVLVKLNQFIMKNNLLRNLSIFSILSLFVMSPVFASADNNSKSKKENKRQEKIEKIEKKEKVEREDDDNDEDEDKKDGNKCWVAYGHLISFGWLKKNNPIEIDADCYLPFGIAKKFRGPTDEPTPPDTTAPIISNILVNSELTRAIISWTTDEKSDSAVFWSTTTPVNTGSTATPNLVQSNKVKNHKIVINGLSASTTYYAIIRSRDASGNTATSSEFSFTTKIPTVAGDTLSPTIFSVVAVVGTSTANIGWQTNEPATSKVYYSTSTPFGLTASSTKFVESASLSIVHLLKLENLATSTTYYAVLESRDAASNTGTSSQFSFTTASGI